MTVLTVLACLFVLSGILAALRIACDLRSHPQPMRIMNGVWVLTGLWAGLLGLWAYYRFGRVPRRDAGMPTPSDNALNGLTDSNPVGAAGPMEGMVLPQGTSGHMEGMSMTRGANGQMDGMVMPQGTSGHMEGMSMTRGANGQMDGMVMPQGTSGHMEGMSMTRGANGQMDGMVMPQRPHWQSVVLSTLHCGAGCTLADLIGEWALFFFPVAIAGSNLAGSWVIDYLLALIAGVWFQYAAIRSMRRIPRSRALLNAVKADFLSLTAWQAGMYAWMAVVVFALRDGAMFPRTSWAFWFTMQLAMYAGFLLALPVNGWLIRKGIKHAM